MQTLLLSNFGKHVDLHILVQSYIQIYITHNNHKHTQTYLQITIHILANINNNNIYSGYYQWKAWMSLAMMFYQVLDGKNISNQQRLKLYIFTVKIMPNRNEK